MFSLIPPQYQILAKVGLIIAWTLAVYFYSAHHTNLGWEVAVAKQSAEAERIKGESDRAKAKTDNENIVAALEAKAAHDAEIATIEGSVNDYAGKYARSLRRLAQCGQNGSNILPRETAGPGLPENDTAGSEEGLPERLGRDLSGLSADANKLASDVRQCFEWAHKVGRQ